MQISFPLFILCGIILASKFAYEMMLAPNLRACPNCEPTPKIPVDVGEVLGLLHALQGLVDMQSDNVGFMVDSKVTVDAFNYLRFDVTEFGHVITTCQNLFSS